MSTLPKSVEATLYIYLIDCSRVVACTHQGMESQGWVLLGTETKTVAVPDVNPVEIELEQLEKAESEINTKHAEAIGNIRGRRAELVALTYQPEVEA